MPREETPHPLLSLKISPQFPIDIIIRKSKMAEPLHTKVQHGLRVNFLLQTSIILPQSSLRYNPHCIQIRNDSFLPCMLEPGRVEMRIPAFSIPFTLEIQARDPAFSEPLIGWEWRVHAPLFPEVLAGCAAVRVDQGCEERVECRCWDDRDLVRRDRGTGEA